MDTAMSSLIKANSLVVVKATGLRRQKKKNHTHIAEECGENGDDGPARVSSKKNLVSVKLVHCLQALEC